MGEIRQGQKVKLNFKTTDDENKEFDCFVVGINKDRLSLTVPEGIANYSEYFQEGCELKVNIFTPLGIKVFDTIIFDSPFESDFVIEYIDDGIRIQRREFARVEVEVQVVIVRENKGNIVAKTFDISGGGIRFIHDGSFKEDELVSAVINLPMQPHTVEAKGIVIKKSHVPFNQHILLFTDIDERDRDRIIRTSFEIQLAKYKTFDEAE